MPSRVLLNRTAIFLARRQFATTPFRAIENTAAKTSDLAKQSITELEKSEPDHRHEDWVLFHPVYTADETKTIKVLHRPRMTMADKITAGLVKTARFGFDLATRYKHPDTAKAVLDAQAEAAKENKTLSLQELRERRIVLTPQDWMARILFLESIAGVPGSVASVLRHLKSLRSMQRDGGWIHTLLAEAENERMHLMSFITIRKPGLFMRLMVLGAQGVFFNLFFASYLISPRACHRFVGYLEEEAVHTYTNCIRELESGRLPEWENLAAPSIAKDYWRLPDNATMLDMIYAVRADESNHRFTNHTLANLKPDDVNPFALREPPADVRGGHVEFSREEALEWSKSVADEARAKLNANANKSS